MKYLSFAGAVSAHAEVAGTHDTGRFKHLHAE
jgi:hypothetical protein